VDNQPVPDFAEIRDNLPGGQESTLITHQLIISGKVARWANMFLAGKYIFPT